MAAVGQEKLDTIVVKGQAYDKVFVIRKDDAYILLTHNKGTLRVLRSDLDPVSLKLVGGYDPAKAKVVIDREKPLTKEEIAARFQPVPKAPDKPEVRQLKDSKLEGESKTK